jgi:hypothetical protein
VTALTALLDDGARFDAEYRGGLSNHLPMALLALRRLGADEARLAAFAAAYAARLEPAPAAAEWPAGEAWTHRLGERAAWPTYRTLFGEWLSYEHPEQVLEQVLPRLMVGCGAAAFHGMIRTAYAAQSGHDGELADALAYWACRWLPLDGTPPATNDGLIFERMQLAAAQAGFEDAVDAVALDAGTLERLSRSSATLYAASGNFTVLHLVTSCHAMRVLLPFADDGLAALDEFIVAQVAGRHACGATAGEPAPLLPWDELVAAALLSDDEHLIKLVDSAREEEAAYGGNEWQRAASRAVLDARR